MTELNEFHEKQTEAFSRYLDSIKAIESEMRVAVTEFKSKTESLVQKEAKVNSFILELEASKKEIDRRLLETGQALERAKSADETRALVLKEASEEAKKLKSEWLLIDRQRADLGEQQKDMNRRKKMVEFEERETKMARLMVDKLARDKAIDKEYKELMEPEQRRDDSSLATIS